MPFLDDFDLVTFTSKFEERDNLVIHELNSNSSAAYPGKLLLRKLDILHSLNAAYLIFSALSLNRNNVMIATLV